MPTLFADDTNAFVSGADLSDLQINSQAVLNKLSEWLLANKLSVNYDKTHYMIFTPTHHHGLKLELNLSINNYQICKVSTTKFLGVHLDENLSC